MCIRDRIESRERKPVVSVQEETNIVLLSLLMDYKKKEKFTQWVNRLLEQTDKKKFRKCLANYGLDIYFLAWRDPVLYYDNYYRDVRTLKEKYMSCLLYTSDVANLYIAMGGRFVETTDVYLLMEKEL